MAASPARVVSNSDPLGIGRVRVEYQPGFNSDWLSPGAGEGAWGPPEVGSVVIVEGGCYYVPERRR